MHFFVIDVYYQVHLFNSLTVPTKKEVYNCHVPCIQLTKLKHLLIN